MVQCLHWNLIADHWETPLPVEVKSGATIASDWFTNLHKWTELVGSAAEPGFLVYGGNLPQKRSMVTVLPWREIGTLAV